MPYMFSYCNMLEKLDLSNFNTTEVTNMSGMFYGCYKLPSLNLSNFNTAKVTNMSQMFYTCKELPSLDLTNFNTAKATNMQEMFKGCSTLQTIYVSDNFVVTGITDENYKKDLFTGCEALKGDLPKYEKTMTSSEYANYKTGYFTKLVGMNGDEKIGATGETLATENLALDDNKDFVAYEPFAAKTASYSRTINTTWATLSLPFEVSLDDQNFRAFELGSVSNNEVVLKELNTIIHAGTPVIIKMNDGETQLNFTEADKEIANEVKTAATADGNYQLQGLYTKKEFSKVADNNCYIVKGFDNDGTTAIDNLNTIADDKAEYYDLQGKRLNEPQKGINIVKRNGKTMKVIIK